MSGTGTSITRPWLGLVILVAAFIAGCGSSNASSSSSVTPTPTGSTSVGDIPDTATYLTYQALRYSLEYVEGWGIQLNTAGGVTISDKDSSEVVALPTRKGQTVSSYAAGDLTRLKK